MSSPPAAAMGQRWGSDGWVCAIYVRPYIFIRPSIIRHSATITCRAARAALTTRARRPHGAIARRHSTGGFASFYLYENGASSYTDLYALPPLTSASAPGLSSCAVQDDTSLALVWQRHGGTHCATTSVFIFVLVFIYYSLFPSFFPSAHPRLSALITNQRPSRLHLPPSPPVTIDCGSPAITSITYASAGRSDTYCGSFGSLPAPHSVPSYSPTETDPACDAPITTSIASALCVGHVCAAHCLCFLSNRAFNRTVRRVPSPTHLCVGPCFSSI